MRSLHFVPAILLSLSAVAFAQTHDHPPAKPAPSEAQQSFETLKTLAGSWEGTVTTVPPMKQIEGARMKAMLRVTSRGNAIMHEMTMTGIPDDPITMLYLDGERVMLTHYCDAGNRPRMAAKVSPDAKKVSFEVLDVSGSTQHGHMADAAFTVVDANHHVEEWTYRAPDGKTIRARFDLERTKEASGPFGQ